MFSKINDFKHVSLTDEAVASHLAIACLGIIAAFVHLVFLPISEYHLITVWAVFGTCLWMFGIIKLMKNGVDYVHKTYNTGEMNRCWNQIMIGLCGITICGIIPRIVTFYYENLYILYYCFMSCFITSVIFFYYFMLEFRQKWKINYDEKKHIPLVLILMAIQIIVLVVSMKIASLYMLREEFLLLLLWQTGATAMFATTFIDIGGILAGGVEKKNDVELETVLVVEPSLLVDPIVEVDSQRPDCKICMVEYSEAVIPRILKECGHTICEKCADQLLDKNNGQHLFCPFCQTVTLVKGPASLLPKNFTITNMIDEKKKLSGP